jgi:hypothetical protein
VSNRLYISLDAVKRDWLSNLADTDDYDDRVVELIRDVSKDIEETCKPHTKATPTYFMPVVETRKFDHAWDTAWLKLDQWLLSVSAFTTKNGETAVAADDYYLLQFGAYDLKPYNQILMKDNGDVPALLYTGTVRQANSITGQWGHCDDTEDTGATLDGALNDSAEAFDVDDGSLIEVGWMLLIGSEQMFVKARSGHRIEVERAQGGTTAASHDDEAAISRYVPPKDITKLAGISIGRLYHRGTTAFADTTGAPPGGLPYVAANVPDALAVINRYRREKWW